MKQNQTKPNLSLFFHLLILFLSGIYLASCGTKSEGQNQGEVESLPEEKTYVATVEVNLQDFTREIISNGKLVANKKAGLYFKTPGIIETVNVHNGQLVNTGDELARLFDDDLLTELKKAELAMEQAELDRLDRLMGMGYNSIDDDIPEDLLRIAEVRSGYASAKIQLEEIEQTLANASLKAPFTGKVEGLKQKAYETVDQSQPFCTLIDDSRFTIEFPLLETEIREVKAGQQLTVTPIIGGNPVKGNITEINPRIDEDGLSWLKAEVVNPGGFIEGMNVKVSIKKAIPGQLVVPKEAVVLRQNREVLFRYSAGTAYWTYVNTLDENENEYSVRAAEGARLEPGDTVIISNNLNLADDTDVVLE